MDRSRSPACLCVVDRAIPVLVPPSEPTPYQVLPLEGVSVMAGLNTLTSSHLLVFKSSKDKPMHAMPAEIIRSGLERVLVPYYPLAGRIRESSTGVLEVECDGSGAIFIVATAKGVPADYPAEIVRELVPKTPIREVQIPPRHTTTVVPPGDRIDVPIQELPRGRAEEESRVIEVTKPLPSVVVRDVISPAKTTTKVIEPERPKEVRIVQIPGVEGKLIQEEISVARPMIVRPPKRTEIEITPLPEKREDRQEIRVRETGKPARVLIREEQITAPAKKVIIQPPKREEVQIVQLPAGAERREFVETLKPPAVVRDVRIQVPEKTTLIPPQKRAELERVRLPVDEISTRVIDKEIYEKLAPATRPVFEEVIVHPPTTAEEAPPVIAGKPLEAPPLIVQVTELSNGDFVLSVKLWRGVCDAAGLLHFLRGWAEMARGAHCISVYPQWSQKLRRQPPTFRPFRLHFPSLLLAGVSCHFHPKPRPKGPAPPIAALQIPLNALLSLRKHLLDSDNLSSSSVDVLAAHLWRKRTVALHVPPSTEVRLFFFADPSTNDKNSELQTPIGYYGPYTFNCQAVSTARDLLERPLSYAVRLIQDAKLHLRDNFTACMDDFTRLHCPCGFAPPEIFIFTELPKSNKSELDFGLGMAAQFVDAFQFPSEVNIAAITSQRQDYNSLHILMNNIPATDVEKLQSLIADVPVYTCKM